MTSIIACVFIFDETFFLYKLRVILKINIFRRIIESIPITEITPRREMHFSTTDFSGFTTRSDVRAKMKELNASRGSLIREKVVG